MVTPAAVRYRNRGDGRRSDLVWAGVGYRPVILGFVDRERRLSRVCGSV